MFPTARNRRLTRPNCGGRVLADPLGIAQLGDPGCLSRRQLASRPSRNDPSLCQD